jgi:Fur family ferric uptake transcriptional regulator
MREVADHILKKNQLSITGSRKKILELFLNNEGALAHADIERKASGQFDRVTVYRTLQVFVEKGIIHSIPTADNSIRYALCKEDCAEGQHHDNHVHFICTSCEKTMCMEDLTVPQVTLPKGFSPHHYQMIVTGTCKDCRN